MNGGGGQGEGEYDICGKKECVDARYNSGEKEQEA